MNVHVLPDRALRDARTKLDALIARARKSKVFADAVVFDEAVWDLAPVKPARNSAGSALQAKLYFTTHDGGTAKGLEGRTPLAKPFADFVKTMIVLREESRPRKAKDHGKLLRAARSLYEGMDSINHDPVNLRSADFLAACNDIRTRKTQRGKVTEPTTAYRLGQGLEEIAEFINRHGLAKVRISFFNPFKRVTYDHTKVDDEAREERAERMASREEIGAIIDVSHMVRQRADEGDLLRMGAVELMACAPVRINELLWMRADCRRSERTRRKSTGEEVEYLGYAYDGSKGAPDTTKWIPSAMMEIADRALADIKRITEPYREIARWMESHPGRAYVAEPWRLADPETMLSHAEVGQALGLAKLSEHRWLEVNGLRKREGRHSRYRLGDIEAAILRQQPVLPDPRLKLSDFMFLVPKHFFREDSAAQPYVLTFVTDQQISAFLGCHKGTKGIFERLDVRNEEGVPYQVNTHALRHFLNTCAQEGLLSQLDIARWSGRKDVRQNADYDHTGGIHLARELRKVLETEAMKGPIADTVEQLPPVDRDAFLKGRFATAHFTSIGACVQDFSLAPCPSHGACAGCGEHLVVKGKPEHVAEAERLLQEHQTMLDIARAEMADGTYNAAAWVDHNERVVDGLKKTVAVHADPTIPDGTMVQV
ncbi:hypothetical protein [Bradyrhizobium japonicum]|uniref:hypothetical protein n=1 Tax=Bradyrhizobium japonicum TaxID=375 RepID=UPI001BAC9A5A|nr:hypothetical protein [Bradyrhizobium japonicum]MBR0910165.1 hypothetical protein [Bradyrhizobium japonicum]